jgi:hypothetical protein
MEPYEVPRGCVILDGKPHECASPVKGVADHGMQFVQGFGARRRMSLTDLIVCHFTADEHDPKTLHRCLLEHKDANGNPQPLGIEFSIHSQPTGPATIYQFCDPAKIDTFDAGAVNARSIGIEGQNFGSGKAFAKGQDRHRYEANINGHGFTFAEFRPSELKAWGDLLDTLTAARRIPRVFPRKPGKLSPEGLARFKGVLGHYHVSGIKHDPGPQLFAYLATRGYTASDLQ